MTAREATSAAFTHVIDRLHNIKGGINGWTARCPSHDDRHNSLSVTEGEDGRVLVHCHAGCEAELIVSALGLEMKDLFEESAGGRLIPLSSRATVQPGFTLAQYAEAKRLPIDFLETLGLSNQNHMGLPVVRIPYLDRNGNEVAVRFRGVLEGDNRFRWKKGAKPSLYGLWRLQNGQERVTLVEGESDCHTLWHHGFAALGLPGANSWKEERDADHLDGIGTIYVVIEPDKGGEAVKRWIAESPIRDRVRLVELGEYKDPSDLHLDSPEQFKARWLEAIAASMPWSENEAFEKRTARREAWEKCEDLARDPNILDRFIADYQRCGVVGEDRNARLLYLAMTSRVFDRPVSVAIKGPSAGGKSFPLEQLLRFFPPETYIARTGMSERALAFGEEPLSHRFLVIAEASGMEGDMHSYLIRSLLSEGVLRYEFVEKTKDGMKNRLIEREGPTGLFVTTTQVSLHPENETRLLSLIANDSPEQTKAIFAVLADEDRDEDAIDFACWHALQDWIGAGEARVTIPFAKQLTKRISTVATRLRRDVAHVLALIRAHALLHQANRKRDPKERIVAMLDDYRTVRELIADLLSEGAEATVPPTVRETVEVVRTHGTDDGMTAKAVGEHLGLDKGTAARRCQRAGSLGYLKNLETQRSRPGRHILGSPMPDDVEILPRVEELGGCAVATKSERDQPPSLDEEKEVEQLEREGIEKYGGG